MVYFDPKTTRFYRNFDQKWMISRIQSSILINISTKVFVFGPFDQNILEWSWWIALKNYELK